MADMRKCIGSAKFGIKAHEAPVGDFPAQPSQKDGLGRMCKPHWTEYTGALRKAALARKAAEGGTVERTAKSAKAARAAVTKPARRRSKVEHPMAHLGRKTKAPKPESAKVQEAKAVLAATESLSGKAYTDAIGSDEVQAALEVAGRPEEGEARDVREEIAAILA